MDDDFLKRLIGMNKETEEARVRYLTLKEETAASKKRYETRQLAVEEALSEYSKGYPLFDRKDDEPGDDDSGGGGGGGGGGGDDDGPSAGPTGGDVIDVEFEVSRPQLPAPAFVQPVPAAFQSEAWRDETIASLVEKYGLSEKTCDLMDEAGVRTIGALADWNRESNRLTDIPGIGQAKATEIEEVMDQFWADWQKRDVPKSGGDLATSRPGTWTDEESAAPDKPKRSRKKSA